MSTVEVRKARDDDVHAIAAIHVRSWQEAYRGVLPDRLLDGLSVPERARGWREILSGDDDRWLTLVAVRGNREPIGFCSVATPSRDEKAGQTTAEVGALYVDPDHWRQGAGGALLASALEELEECGWHDAILWVLPENHAALAFYRRFGFEVEEGVEKREERSGRIVIRLRIALAEGQGQGWEIRSGAERDIHSVLALWSEAGGRASGTDTEGALRGLLARDPEALLVAEASGEAVGSLIVGWDGWRGSFYRLAVHPGWRRRGMATALIRAGEERLRKLGARRLTAIVAREEDAAIDLWTAAGFERQTDTTRFVRMLEEPC